MDSLRSAITSIWGYFQKDKRVAAAALGAAAGLFALCGLALRRRNLWNVSSKVFLITGASSGIGKALALKLCAMGAKVSLVARREAELNQVVAECNKQAAQSAFGVVGDVSVRADCHRMVSSTISHFGRVDVIVLNAGVSAGALFEQVTDGGLDAFENLTAVNYYGPVYTTHFALPELIKNKGKVVVVSSVFGLHGGPTRSFYAGSKFALHGFFESLRLELEAKDVTVHMICPGPVATDIARNRVGPDGQPATIGHFEESAAISAETASSYIVDAVQTNQRIRIFGLGANIMYLFSPMFPCLFDKLFVRAMNRLKMMEERPR